MDKISDHISYREAVKSNTATRRGIDNIPDVQELENMKLIAEKVFEPFRKFVKGPIKINSFYRSPELNVAIGGSKNSQHCKGQAIDIDRDGHSLPNNAEIFEYIKNNLDFDQLILENYAPNRVSKISGEREGPNSGWVHVSYSSIGDNRKEVMRMVKVKGKPKYYKGLWQDQD